MLTGNYITWAFFKCVPPVGNISTASLGGYKHINHFQTRLRTSGFAFPAGIFPSFLF